MAWRDVDRDGVSQAEFWKQMKPHIKRFLKFWNVKDIGHAWLNMYTEANRISAYHSAHVTAYILILHLVIIMGLIFL